MGVAQSLTHLKSYSLFAISFSLVFIIFYLWILQTQITMKALEHQCRQKCLALNLGVFCSSIIILLRSMKAVQPPH